MKDYVAIEKKVCPICGENFDTGILMHTGLKKVFPNKEVTTGFAFCRECKENIDKGYVGMVAIDPEKSQVNKSNGTETVSAKDAYRTGTVAFIKRDKLEEILGKEYTEDLIFVEEEVITNLEAQV